MKRAVLVMVMVGCGGGDDSATPDAPVNQGPDYDLSCLGNSVTSVPTTITLTGSLYNATLLPDLAPIGASTITAYSLVDDSQAGTTTVADDGTFTLDLTTNGTPTRMRYAIESQLLPTTFTVSLPPWKSGMGGMFVSGSQRVDNLATALGGTADAANGTLEVWLTDCSGTDMPGASLKLDGADVSWAMFGGVGAWLPRTTTIAHPNNFGGGSIAGTINVTPGPHTVTMTAPGVTFESTTVVEAGGWTLLLMTPGFPL